MTDSTAPEQIIINGQAYSPEDATQLIELGNKWKETESKLNTSLDKVYPKYTEASQKLKEYETQLAERNAELEKYKQEQIKAQTPETPDEIKKARQAARELGLADEDYLKEKGYMTRSELDAYYQEKEQLAQNTKSILDTNDKLAKEIDGTDGRLAYNPKSVLAYANTYGFFKQGATYEEALRNAYDDLSEPYNAKWKAEQLAKEERPGLTTLKPGGAKSPQRPKVTNDNLGQMLGEFLNGIPE